MITRHSTSTDNSVTYRLDVTVEQKVGQVDPATTLPIEFDVVFTEAIDNTTFVVGDISQGGTATGITWNLINSGDDINFTLQATAIVGAGTVIPSLNAAVVQTSEGADNTASTSVDNSVTFDSLDVTIDQKVAKSDPANVLPIEFDIVFDRPSITLLLWSEILLKTGLLLELHGTSLTLATPRIIHYKQRRSQELVP